MSLPEDLYRQIVESMPDAVIVADREGVIRLWDGGAEAIFGYNAEEAVGQPLDLIVPERLRQRHWDGYHHAMKEGTTKYGLGQLLSVPALRKDGARISIEFTIAVLHDEQGGLLGPLAVVRDVTARWQQEKELRERLAAAEAQLAARPAAGEEPGGREVG